MEAGSQFGSYELVAKLGGGGMGEVWRARHRNLQRDAAVKVIRPDALGMAANGAAAANLLKRFEREAQATSGLRSPHTIELYDFGTTADGTFFYAMELLEGLSLRELVERYGPVESDRVAAILAQTCDSLAEAHHSGFIHRDIKPANIFLCRLGLVHDFVKVLDFGLVKRESGDADQSQLTSDGMAPGSPAFMAPEVARGDDVDGRADLYSLGCVGYWLITGQLVFDTPRPIDAVIAHVQQQPDRPSTRSEVEVPEYLESAVMACLSKDPDRRPRSATDLKALLNAGVSQWTHDKASSWWNTHLPDLSHATTPRAPTATGSPKPEATASPATGSPSTGSPVTGSPVTGSPSTGRPHIDTAVAMAEPELTTELDRARAATRSVLEHNFTQSQIDMGELERRLILVRAANTEADLAEVVGDLAAPQDAPEATPIPIVEHPHSGVPARRSKNVIGIFGGSSYGGNWSPPPEVNVISVFGGSELDFREANIQCDVIEVKCFSVFGGSEIIVSPEMYVEVDGVGIFGGFSHNGQALGSPAEGVPTIRVTGLAIFGGVDVKVKDRKKLKKKR